MYLSKRTYVKNYPSTPEEDRDNIVITGPKANLIVIDRITEIIEEVMYWRKANQIHSWFVENVQGGIDDYKPYNVSSSQLIELLTLVNQALKKPTKADEILPPANGFFFGDNEINSYYFQDLKETKDALTKILAETGSSEFIYQANW